MDDDQVQYSAENYAPARRVQTGGGITGLIMRLRLAKNEKQASTVLVITAIICVVLGAAVWFMA